MADVNDVVGRGAIQKMADAVVNHLAGIGPREHLLNPRVDPLLGWDEALVHLALPLLCVCARLLPRELRDDGRQPLEAVAGERDVADAVALAACLQRLDDLADAADQRMRRFQHLRR